MAAIEQEYETTRMAELIEKRQKIIDEHNVLGCFDVLYHLQEHVNCVCVCVYIATISTATLPLGSSYVSVASWSFLANVLN